MADRNRKRDPFEGTILFVTVCVPLEQLTVRWRDDCDEFIIRRCPFCEKDTIVGHGWRKKQAHDEYHDWIRIRRGVCSRCGTTFTFLPVFSLPYTHYSLLARSQALQQRFQEHCSWEKAVPTLKDPDRVPDASTVRRWSSGVDSCQPEPSFLHQAMTRIVQWLNRGRGCDVQVKPMPWMVPALEVLWPLRL